MAGSATDQPSWDRTVVSVDRLPKYWKAGWLQKADVSVQPFTQAVLDLVDAHDSRSIVRIFQLMTGLHSHCPLPKSLRASKALCAKTLCARHCQLGEPMRDWARRFVSPTGAIDWATAGAYEVIWEQDRAVRIKYLFGRAEAPVTVPIMRNFQLLDPWDAAKARVEKPPARYFFWEFFPKRSGPNADKMDKAALGLDQIAQREAVELNDAAKIVKNCIVFADEDFVGQALLEKKKTALKEVQVKAMVPVKRRRTISLASVQAPIGVIANAAAEEEVTATS